MRFTAGNDDLTGRGPSPVQLFDESVLAGIEMQFRDGGVTPSAHVVDVGTESFRILLSTHHANAENTRRVGCPLGQCDGSGFVVAAFVFAVLASIAVLSAIGDIARFASAEKLVSYLGLDPRVRQSGDRAAQHGRISKQGRAHARGMLVEAAWAAVVTPGPLRAFYVRVQGRKGKQVAAVATARKIAVLAWHLLTKQEDYAFARPALVAMKERQMQMKAGAKSRRGGNTPGPARNYSIKELREKERALVQQAEHAYARFVSAWSEKPKPNRERSPRDNTAVHAR